MSNITNPTEVYDTIIDHLDNSPNKALLADHLIAGLYKHLAKSASSHSDREKILTALNKVLTEDDGEQI